jgi:hypothetical protein
MKRFTLRPFLCKPLVGFTKLVTEQGIEPRTNNGIGISLGLGSFSRIFRLVGTEEVVLDKLTKTIVLQTGNTRGRVKQTRPVSMSFLRAVGFHPKPPPHRSF